MPRKTALTARKEVRFLPDQLLLIEEWCKQRGIDSSAFIRQAAIEKLRRDQEAEVRPAYTRFGICARCGLPCEPGTSLHQECASIRSTSEKIKS